MNFSPILLGIIVRRPFNPRSDIQQKLEDDGFRYATGHSRSLQTFAISADGSSLFRLRRPLLAEELQRLGFQLVGGHEEFFQLFLDLGRQVLNALQLPLAVRILGNGDDAIIADSVALGFFNRLKDADDLAAQHQPRRGGRVVNDHSRADHRPRLGSTG